MVDEPKAYSVVREAIFTEDEEGILISAKNGRSLVYVAFSNDKNTLNDPDEGEFVNPVHSSELKSFVNEGEGAEYF